MMIVAMVGKMQVMRDTAPRCSARLCRLCCQAIWAQNILEILRIKIIIQNAQLGGMG